MANRPEMPGSNTLGLSQALWSDMPLDHILAFRDRAIGVGMYDDFVNFSGALSTNDGEYRSGDNNYLSYQTASTFIIPVALTPTPATVAPTSIGAIKFSPTSGVADNDIMSLQWGGQLASPYGVAPFAVIPGISKDLVFEARFKVSSVAASIGDFFVGLAGAAGIQLLTSVLPIADADTLTTTHSLLGFSRLGAETTGCYLTHQRSGGTVRRANSAGTVAADTYFKAGFKWDGTAQTLTPWFDGAEVSTYRIPAGSATYATGATPWPNDYMTPAICVHQIDGTTALELTIDWWACAQLL